MEQAKAAIQDFTSKAGHHDTTVHEHHRPAVTHEHISPTRHEEATTVIDREVHQDHHHTSVQPIHDREVLPEKHHHNIIPVEHKEHEHGDHRGVKERLAAEAAQFKDVTEKGETHHTHEVKPMVGGEHVHHHVHETIQPIIQKETIQPTVIHTTIPIHEVHHNEPKHHAATALPAVSMADFKKQGGSLTGRADRTDHFEGEPQAETAEQHAHHAGIHHHGLTDRTTGSATAGGLGSGTHDRTADVGERDRSNHGLGAGTTAAGAGTAGVAAAEARHHDQANSKMDPRVDQRIDSTSRRPVGTADSVGTDRTTSTNTSAASPATAHTTDSVHQQHKLHKDQPSQYADTHAGSRMDMAADRDAEGKLLNHNQHKSNFEAANVTSSSVPATEASATGQKKRSSLLDRLNPLKDSDGDGKKGVMN